MGTQQYDLFGTTLAERNLISGNTRGGICLYESSGNSVQGNLFGTDVTGTYTEMMGGNWDTAPVQADLRNKWDAITLSHSPSNQIGGIVSSPGQPPGNVLSGSGLNGVSIYGAESIGNQIMGNLIGLDARGVNKLANGRHGVAIYSAPGNIIGGPELGARNVISGNGVENLILGTNLNVMSTGHGVYIEGSTAVSNRIQGNYLGPDITGGSKPVLRLRVEPVLDYKRANNGEGILIKDAPYTLIGGAEPGAGNVISGNEIDGIGLQGLGASNTVIQGNLIGSAADALAPLANKRHGIYFSNTSSNLIGGAQTNLANYIAYNGTLTPDAHPEVSPYGHGIYIENSAGIRTVGNVIAYNATDGISITWDRDNGRDKNNLISSNSIHDNGWLGIDLGDDYRVQPKRVGDQATGPNRFQNYPVLLSYQVDSPQPGRQTVRGFLDSRPTNTYRLEFFSNIQPDESGFGEGDWFVGFTNVTTGTDGRADFSVVLPVSAHNITATATDAENNTSEFSSLPPIIVNLASDEPDADPNDGVADIDTSKEGLQTTLRAALQEANRRSGRTIIVFDIPSARIPVIRLLSPLPLVSNPVVIDATTQGHLGNSPYATNGWVELDGTALSVTADGLAFSQGDNAVGGLIIHGFKGSALTASGNAQYLRVASVELRDNQQWGVYSPAAHLTINTNTPGVLYPQIGPLTLITCNGLAAEGGGIFGGRTIEARQVEISTNAGAGLVASNHIDLYQFKINQNLGPGVQSFQGYITIQKVTANYSEDNEVVGNSGPGIISGIDTQVRVAKGDMNAIFRDIVIGNHIRIQDNAGWGIFNIHGNVYLNVTPAPFHTPASPKTSYISGNGDSNKVCYWRVVDYTGKDILVKISPKIEHGGIAANGGALEIARAEISGNRRGPGLLAYLNAIVTLAKITDNGGPGIQVINGPLVWNPHTEDGNFKNQVLGNAGSGIFVGTRPDLFLSSSVPGQVTIGTDVEIRNNAGWGIFCEKGDVFVNASPATGEVLQNRISLIVSNGNPQLPLRHYDSGDNFTELSQNRRPGRGGGIGAGNGEVKAGLVDISGNAQGGGIVARGDIELRAFRLRGNNGPGLQSAERKIQLLFGTGPHPDGNEISDNAGPGVLTGTYLETMSSRPGLPPLVILGPVLIARNSGWGIFNENGEVQINVLDLLSAVKGPVIVVGNGETGLPCQYYDDEGELRTAPRSGGGVFAGGTDLVAAALTVTNNLGVGLSARGMITLNSGVLCNNRSGDLFSESPAKISSEVVRCDSDHDGVSDSIEAGAPNNGDGNRDGLPDNQQAQVASFGSASGHFVTLAGASSALIQEAAGTSLTPGAALPGALAAPEGFLHFAVAESSVKPNGLLPQSVSSAKAFVVDLFLPADSKVTGYYLFSPTLDSTNAHWFAFDYDGVTGAELLSDRIRLHFLDGGRGDADLAVNGRILHAWGGPTVELPAVSIRLQTITCAANGTIQFWLSAPTHNNYAIEFSTNLGHWTPLFQTNLLQNLIQVTDPEAPLYPRGFYRAKSPP